MSKTGEFSHVVTHVRRAERDSAEEEPERWAAGMVGAARSARRRARARLRAALADPSSSPRVRTNARALLERWSEARPHAQDQSASA